MLEIRSCEGGTLERHAILGSAVGALSWFGSNARRRSASRRLVRCPSAGSMYGQAFRVPVFVGMSVVFCVWAIARWVRRMRMLLNLWISRFRADLHEWSLLCIPKPFLFPVGAMQSHGLRHTPAQSKQALARGGTRPGTDTMSCPHPHISNRCQQVCPLPGFVRPSGDDMTLSKHTECCADVWCCLVHFSINAAGSRPGVLKI